MQMLKFSYKAKEGPSKIVEGIVEAENSDNAIRKVMQLGLTPIDVSVASTKELKVAQRPSKPARGFFRKVRLLDLAIFTRQIYDLVDASVPMLRSLQIVSKQTQNPTLKEMIERMYEVVRDGGSFSDALGKYPNVFSVLYVNMVKTGEVGGNLDVVMHRLADYLEKEYETRNKIRSSLAYPMFILVVGIIAIFVLLTFFIPQITVMFDDLEQRLPLPTIILTNISGVFAQYWWLFVGLFAGLFFYMRQWLQTAKGRIWMDTLKLRLPLLGEFIKVAEVGRFARTLGTLLENGVVITTALNSVWATMDNVILSQGIKDVSEEVASGTSLKEALKKCPFFPELAVNMIAVGEETGKLERGLYKIAETFERQTDQTIKTIMSLLGPVILVTVVLIVGFVVVAMLLPIFQMNLLVQ